MLTVKEFYSKHGDVCNLELYAGRSGLLKSIKGLEIERPGLALSGFLKGHSDKRVMVFGRVEMEYIRKLSRKERLERLNPILSKRVPMIIVSRRLIPFKEIIEICNKEKIPLFRTKLTTAKFMSKLTVILSDEFCPTMSCHGTLVETFGVGVLIQGDSSVGKSETALGLIERRHRLISDDVVIVKKKEGSELIGTGPELTRHLLEIRGIGIINVAHLYGAVCISESSKIDIIVKLEEWDDQHFYDRVGLEEKYFEILGEKVPYFIMPVKPGRDVVLLLETIVLNNRLKGMGYNSAKEFNVKLLETITHRQNLQKKKKTAVKI